MPLSQGVTATAGIENRTAFVGVARLQPSKQVTARNEAPEPFVRGLCRWHVHLVASLQQHETISPFGDGITTETASTNDTRMRTKRDMKAQTCGTATKRAALNFTQEQKTGIS